MKGAFFIQRYSDLISVAHCFEQDGDLIPDPDVELPYPTWTPTVITQLFGYRREKFIERDGKSCMDTSFRKEISSCLALWARNIPAQGWTEKGRIHHMTHFGREVAFPCKRIKLHLAGQTGNPKNPSKPRLGPCNASFNYLYRDASNYKLYGEAVFTNHTFISIRHYRK